MGVVKPKRRIIKVKNLESFNVAHTLSTVIQQVKIYSLFHFDITLV